MTPRPASTEEVVLGCIAFTVWWFLAVFPKVPFLPIGRTAGSLLGASLMVLFRVLSPRKAFASVDLSILTLLFGTMILTGYLERADLFRYLGYALSWRSQGGTDLLCRLSLLAALSSAIFTNDTTCVVLTQFVMMLCREKNLPPDPFLIALACSANIGSAGTLIGNPQNLVIAQQSRMGFRTFSAGVMPAVAIGLAANTLGLYLVYRRWLSQPQPAKEFLNKSSNLEQSIKELDGDLPCLSRSQSANEHSEEISLLISEPIEVGEGIERSSSQMLVPGPIVDVESPDPSYGRVGLVGRVANAVRVLWRPLGGKGFNSEKVGPLVVSAPHHDAAPPYKQETWLWKISVYMVTLGMLVAFLSGMDLPWSALMSAMVLMVLDWRDAGVSLNKVKYPLLVFFAGMFITVAGFNETGVPEKLWVAVEPYAHIDTSRGLLTLSLVITVLSNLASNVPTVLLLGPRLAASAATTIGVSSVKAWMVLGWVSTVAGNFTLMGSAANIIVSEEAHRTKDGHELTFWNHLRFGVPSTLIVIVLGLPFIHEWSLRVFIDLEISNAQVHGDVDEHNSEIVQ